MSVATKNRRKISVKGQQYLWYVAENEDCPGMVLHVLSPDKRLIVEYQIDQPEGNEYIGILRKVSVGAKFSGFWKQFLCPRFIDRAATPQSVRTLIEWCLDENLARQEIDWRSRSLSL